MTREISLPPCECFTVLDSREDRVVAQCDVCDEFEVAHPDVGRRILSGGAIEELRKQMIIGAYDKLEGEDPHDESASPLERPPAPFEDDRQ
jgi:hypothetical protein